MDSLLGLPGLFCKFHDSPRSRETSCVSVVFQMSSNVQEGAQSPELGESNRDSSKDPPPQLKSESEHVIKKPIRKRSQRTKIMQKNRKSPGIIRGRERNGPLRVRSVTQSVKREKPQSLMRIPCCWTDDQEPCTYKTHP